MNIRTLSGKWALVTGASSGLGADFARQLANWGVNLVLTARRKAAMDLLAEEIRQAESVQVKVIVCDLGAAGGPEELVGSLAQMSVPIDILINNAGFGAYGPFDQIPWEKENAMLELDIVRIVQLTKAFSVGMKSRGFGLILQIASIGAFQPTPLYASYSAAKAFVLSYGIAVNRELKGSGVSCTVLSPGVTSTGFFDAAGQEMTTYQRLVMMKSPDVVRIGLRALVGRRSAVVPGIGNKISAFMTRFAPRTFAAVVAERLMQ